MDFIDKVLEKLREWVRRLTDAILGPQPEPVTIPVDDRSRRNP
ncbi:MAG: hypothetical protein ACKO3I_09070 [Synechococcales cyanobacterium]